MASPRDGRETEGRKLSLLFSGCLLINITFLINTKASSTSHLERLPRIHFSFGYRGIGLRNEGQICVFHRVTY